jgi:CRP-like cAMP-binding protein
MTAEALAAHSFLSGLTVEQLDRLSALALRVQFHPGESIFRQRGVADGFYLLRKGSVKLEYEVPGQRGIEIQKIGAGELLGLSWLFAPNKWEFSATAIDVVEADFFRAIEVRAECVRDPKLGYELMERIAKVLTERLQATRHKLRVFVERATNDAGNQQVC